MVGTLIPVAAIALAALVIRWLLRRICELDARKVHGMARRHPERLSGSDRAAGKGHFPQWAAESWPHGEWLEEIEAHDRRRRWMQ